jgi:hypothetical protein
MIQVRFHGRGGQRAKIASRILGRSGFLSGLQVQDFALFGAERRGAPVVSFTRLSKEPIDQRGHIVDLSEKAYRASKHQGPKPFIAHSPCPPGWEFDPEWSVEVARLAVETGVWPLKEAIHGAVSHTQTPRTFKPVEEYLKRQGRFRHLFEPKRDDELIAKIQESVDEYWKNISHKIVTQLRA